MIFVLDDTSNCSIKTFDELYSLIYPVPAITFSLKVNVRFDDTLLINPSSLGVDDTSVGAVVSVKTVILSADTLDKFPALSTV